MWLNYVTELQLHRLPMELIGEMHSTETDETYSEIEHYFNMRVPSEFDNKPWRVIANPEQSC